MKINDTNKKILKFLKKNPDAGLNEISRKTLIPRTTVYDSQSYKFIKNIREIHDNYPDICEFLKMKGSY